MLLFLNLECTQLDLFYNRLQNVIIPKFVCHPPGGLHRVELFNEKFFYFSEAVDMGAIPAIAPKHDFDMSFYRVVLLIDEVPFEVGFSQVNNKAKKCFSAYPTILQQGFVDSAKSYIYIHLERYCDISPAAVNLYVENKLLGEMTIIDAETRQDYGLEFPSLSDMLQAIDHSFSSSIPFVVEYVMNADVTLQDLTHPVFIVESIKRDPVQEGKLSFQSYNVDSSVYITQSYIVATIKNLEVDWFEGSANLILDVDLQDQNIQLTRNITY